jgi:hypothetical protein
MSPRPSHYATLRVERFEERINPADTDPVSTLVGGSAALSALTTVDTSFFQGYTNAQAVLNALGGPTDFGHVVADTQGVFGTLYGGSYLENARRELGFALRAISSPDATSADITHFGQTAQALAFAAGAAYAVEQDLVAHAIPILGTIASYGPSATQLVQNAAIATFNSVVTIVNSLNHLATGTAEEVMSELAQPLVPPYDPTATMPLTPPPPAPPMPPPGNVDEDGDGDNGDDFDGDDAFY